MRLNQFIRLTRKEKKFSLIHLAHISGLTYSMLYRIEEGSLSKPHPDILKRLSEPLSVSYESLLEISGYLPKHETMQTQKTIPQEIPILAAKAIIDLYPFPKSFPKEISQTRTTTTIQDTNLFALVIQTHQWNPIFQKHDVLIISPAHPLKHRNIVLVKTYDKIGLLLCYYLTDQSPGIYLQSLNHQALPEVIQISDKHIILGKVCEHKLR